MLTMAPKTRKSVHQLQQEALDKEKKLTLRIKTERNVTHIKCINIALMAEPTLAPGVVQHLQGVGVDFKNMGLPDEDMAKPVAPADDDEIEEKVLLASDRDVLPACYTAIRLLTALCFLKWLPKIDWIALAEVLLRTMAKAGKKKVPLQVLKEIFEFCTGLNDSHDIPADWHTEGVFTKNISQRYAARGKPAMQLKLWPD